MGMIEIVETAKPSEPIEIIKVVDLLEYMAPILSFSLVKTQAEALRSAPSSPSAANTLRTQVEFLDGHFSFEDR